MHFNWLALSVPFFILLMYAEYRYSRKRGFHHFNRHNSLANISIGVAERLTDVLMAGGFYFIYDYLHRHYAIFNIRPGAGLWILLLCITDFLWYWYHRLAHEINLLWMVHIVHHQSEDFNYTVSARITVLQALVRTLFWAILPVIGFPPGMIVSLLLLHGLYPFFIHTQAIGNLGVLEYIFVTPSHHRVHHASNPEYLDRNYGDVLIIWDKLFGTFRKEDPAIPPVYGLTKPLKSRSFLWQHFHYAVELWLGVQQQRGFWQKLSVIFGRPDTLNPELREKAESMFSIKQQSHEMDQPLNRYVVVQLAVQLLLLAFFIGFEASLPPVIRMSFTIFTLLTLINCGAIMEKRTWVFHVEILRLLSVVVIPCFYRQYINSGMLALGAAAVFMLLYYRSVQAFYLRLLYRRRR